MASDPYAEELHTGHGDTCPMGLLINPEDPHDRRTLCRRCQALGPDATTTRVEQEDSTDAVDSGSLGVPVPESPTRLSFLWEAEQVAMYQDQLGLAEWTIRLGEGFDEDLDEDAYVRVEPRERVATIFVNPEARVSGRECIFQRLVAHELIHVLLFDLQSMAMNDRSIPIMDLIDTELERVINRLATAITGCSWEPIDHRVRELHEFDSDGAEFDI